MMGMMDEVLREEQMEEIALRVLAYTFGRGAFPTSLNKAIAPKIVQKYFMNGEDAHRAQREIGNFIWMNYSGGDTCHSAAERIINGWKEANLI